MKSEPRVYGLIAAFASEDALLRAASNTHAAGYRRIDGYSPFPIEGLADALGRKPFGVPFLFLAGGTLGCIGGFLLQWFAMAVDYPLNISGKPLNSWPMFIPVTFELTILGAALTGFLGTLFLNGALELYHPVFNLAEFRERNSSDGFFLCIEASDPKFHHIHTDKFLRGLAPLWVREVET